MNKTRRRKRRALRRSEYFARMRFGSSESGTPCGPPMTISTKTVWTPSMPTAAALTTTPPSSPMTEHPVRRKDRMSEWRSIDTAPKDGTEIIGCHFTDHGFGGVSRLGPWTVAFFRNRWRSSWDGAEVIESMTDFGTDYKAPDLQPTHWMPLPAPPKAAARTRRAC